MNSSKPAKWILAYLLISASQKRPLVVAIEDLHWMDKTFEEFLNYFIDWLTHSPILLILLYRPEYNHQWSSRSPYTKIGLSQLTSQSSAELIRAILSRKNIAEACRLRAQVFLAEGRLEEALQELSTALEVAHRIGNPPQLWKTYTILGDLHQAQGRIEEAYRAYGDALSIIEKVSKNLSNESLRDTFISSVFVQEIRQKARMADSKKET